MSEIKVKYTQINIEDRYKEIWDNVMELQEAQGRNMVNICVNQIIMLEHKIKELEKENKALSKELNKCKMGRRQCII